MERRETYFQYIYIYICDTLGFPLSRFWPCLPWAVSVAITHSLQRASIIHRRPPPPRSRPTPLAVKGDLFHYRSGSIPRILFYVLFFSFPLSISDASIDRVLCGRGTEKRCYYWNGMVDFFFSGQRYRVRYIHTICKNTIHTYIHTLVLRKTVRACSYLIGQRQQVGVYCAAAFAVLRYNKLTYL